MKVLYFNGTIPLFDVHGVTNLHFESIGGVKSKHNRYDSFKRLVGYPVKGCPAILPVTRRIEYKSNPSLHKCDSRCQSAKGHSCECSCSGQFHGSAS